MGTKPASGELNKALRPLFSKLPSAHIIHDDVVIATTTEEEHELVTVKVLDIIEEAGLTLNPEKCMFTKEQTPFWGMVISGKGIRPDQNKVQGQLHIPITSRR